jgi:hypothetical protein
MLEWQMARTLAGNIATSTSRIESQDPVPEASGQHIAAQSLIHKLYTWHFGNTLLDVVPSRGQAWLVEAPCREGHLISQAILRL